jgi:hypothetical protein
LNSMTTPYLLNSPELASSAVSGVEPDEAPNGRRLTASVFGFSNPLQPLGTESKTKIILLALVVIGLKIVKKQFIKDITDLIQHSFGIVVRILDERRPTSPEIHRTTETTTNPNSSVVLGNSQRNPSEQMTIHI